MDVSHAAGTPLRIRMRPPVGYWAFNSFVSLNVSHIPANSARTSEGKDIRQDLAAADDRCYPMPEMTDQAELTFAARFDDLGAHYRIAPVEDWEESLHLIARGSPHKLAGCEHSPMIEQPAEFNAGAGLIPVPSRSWYLAAFYNARCVLQ